MPFMSADNLNTPEHIVVVHSGQRMPVEVELAIEPNAEPSRSADGGIARQMEDSYNAVAVSAAVEYNCAFAVRPVAFDPDVVQCIGGLSIRIERYANLRIRRDGNRVLGCVAVVAARSDGIEIIELENALANLYRTHEVGG